MTSPTTLPNLLIVGAMKCGTSALHRYLGCHPEIAMAEPKELNFFFGPAHSFLGSQSWCAGNWHRGVAWYAGHFTDDVRVRGESSPGYTSPSHPEVAERVAAIVPFARLVYVVRDPIDRAVSQYRHHRSEGTEDRSLEEALLDPRSQYLARSRYFERLEPFTALFPRRQLMIVCTEDLHARRRRTLRGLFAWLRVDEGFWAKEHDGRWHSSVGPVPDVPGSLRRKLAAALRDDAERLRRWARRDFAGWSV